MESRGASSMSTAFCIVVRSGVTIAAKTQSFLRKSMVAMRGQLYRHDDELPGPEHYHLIGRTLKKGVWSGTSPAKARP